MSDDVVDPGRAKNLVGLSALHGLKQQLPQSKIGAMIALLPEIRELRRQGHTGKAIWQALGRDGINMSYGVFRVYLGRARRRVGISYDAPKASLPVPQLDGLDQDSGPITVPARAIPCGRDPFAGVRQKRKQSAGERFDYDALTPLKEDLLR
jgi:hypothetical protein